MKSDKDVQKRAVSTDCCERLLKLVCHKAAGRADTEAYVLGTVRWTGDRERSWKELSVADCNLRMANCEAAFGPT